MLLVLLVLKVLRVLFSTCSVDDARVCWPASDIAANAASTVADAGAADAGAAECCNRC